MLAAYYLKNNDLNSAIQSLKDEINVINSNTFIMPRFLTTNTDFFVDEAIGIIPQHTSRMVSVQNNSVNLETGNSYVLIDETGALSV